MKNQKAKKSSWKLNIYNLNWLKFEQKDLKEKSKKFLKCRTKNTRERKYKRKNWRYVGSIQEGQHPIIQYALKKKN